MSSEGLRLRFKALSGFSRPGSHHAARGLKWALNWGETSPYVVTLMQKKAWQYVENIFFECETSMCEEHPERWTSYDVQGKNFQKTCFLNLFCKQNAHWVNTELDQHSILLKFLLREHFQKNIHAQAEVVFFSFFCALQHTLKMEWSLDQNPYLPFLKGNPYLPFCKLPR